jgi:hypothetical protein
MEKVVYEMPSACGTYGYTYSVLGMSCKTTTSQHTWQAAFRHQAEVLLHYKNIKHVA